MQKFKSEDGNLSELYLNREHSKNTWSEYNLDNPKLDDILDLFWSSYLSGINYGSKSKHFILDNYLIRATIDDIYPQVAFYDINKIKDLVKEAINESENDERWPEEMEKEEIISEYIHENGYELGVSIKKEME